MDAAWDDSISVLIVSIGNAHTQKAIPAEAPAKNRVANEGVAAETEGEVATERVLLLALQSFSIVLVLSNVSMYIPMPGPSLRAAAYTPLQNPTMPDSLYIILAHFIKLLDCVENRICLVLIISTGETTSELTDPARTPDRNTEYADFPLKMYLPDIVLVENMTDL